MKQGNYSLPLSLFVSHAALYLDKHGVDVERGCRIWEIPRVREKGSELKRIWSVDPQWTCSSLLRAPLIPYIQQHLEPFKANSGLSLQLPSYMLFTGRIKYMLEHLSHMLSLSPSLCLIVLVLNVHDFHLCLKCFSGCLPPIWEERMSKNWSL